MKNYWKGIKNWTWYFCTLSLLLVGITALIVSCGGSSGGDDGDGDTTPTSENIFIGMDRGSPLFAALIDDDNNHFWFYGERDKQGFPDYINQFVATNVDDDGNMVEKITIEFDDMQRPTKFTLPDLEGYITFEYPGSSTIKVTIYSPNGDVQSFTVNTTVADIVQPTRPITVDKFCETISGFDPSDYQAWYGIIEACNSDLIPNMEIEIKDIPEDNFDKIRINVLKHPNKPGVFNYEYSILFCGDYDKWFNYCHCIGESTVLVLMGGIASLPFSISYSILNIGLETFRGLQNGEGLLEPIESILTKMINTLYDKYNGIGELISTACTAIEEGTTLPCSEERFNYIQSLYRKPVTFKCSYLKKTKEADFDPMKNSGPLPVFNFSDMCCDEEKQAGSDAPVTNTHLIGITEGTFRFYYQTYDVKDQIYIMQNGKELFNSGCVGKEETVTVTLQGGSPYVVVDVKPNCEYGTSGTQWNYLIYCPD